MENTLSTKKPGHASIYEPPGGILIWIIIFVEIVTFAAVLSAFIYQRIQQPGLFNASQHMLDKTIGTVNTIILLTSGFFMAESVKNLKRDNRSKSLNALIVTIILGAAFILLKGFEYSVKIHHGIGLEYNTFFTYYWLLTGFHLIHVFVGLIILSYFYFKIKNGFYAAANHEDVETGASFWHMCDLIWMLLFPTLYLLH